MARETMERPGMMTRPIAEMDDLVCTNCGCEIQVKHVGDPARGAGTRSFTCTCGTRMDFENGPGQRPAGMGADAGQGM